MSKTRVVNQPDLRRSVVAKVPGVSSKTAPNAGFVSWFCPGGCANDCTEGSSPVNFEKFGSHLSWLSSIGFRGELKSAHPIQTAGTQETMDQRISRKRRLTRWSKSPFKRLTGLAFPHSMKALATTLDLAS